MEKLIELLNEYEKDGLNEFETYVERWYCERTYQILSGKWENSNELKPCEIISKRYGFIKWLVENDKIDFENMEGHGRLIGYLTDNMEKPTRDKVKEELVIMLLSISNSPIEDLLLYLK